MAIINSFTSNGTLYPQAYIQVSIHRCDTSTTVLQLKAWVDEESKRNGEMHLPVQLADPLDTDLEYRGNPLNYAYDSCKKLTQFIEALDV